MLIYVKYLAEMLFCFFFQNNTPGRLYHIYKNIIL